MEPHIFVSPDGQNEREVTTPVVATRMRARGWKPRSDRPAVDSAGDAQAAPAAPATMAAAPASAVGGAEQVEPTPTGQRAATDKPARTK